MPFARPLIKVAALVLWTAVLPPICAAQEEAPVPLYVEVHCMKSTSADYADVETAMWQPMHQEMVKKGKKDGWSLYWVLYGDRSKCDYYTVDAYRGLGQLNEDRPLGEFFAAVHPGKSWEEAQARTAAARTMVRSELWVWVDGVQPTSQQLVSINYMYAQDGAQYLEFERETWKPVHQALVGGEHTAGWGLYELLSPHGSAIPYNFATADFLTRLGPLPIEETMRSVHPEREAATIVEEGLELRDHLLSETWVLLASTE